MKTIYLTKKSFLATLLSSLALVLTVACNGASNNSGAAVGYGYGYGGVGTACATCSGTPIGQSFSYTPYGDMQMSLQLYGQSMTYGPLALSGTLQINSPYNPTFCGAPVGVYQLTTIQAGAIQGTAVGGGLVLMATGPTTIQINVQYGNILPDGSLSLTFVSQNGYTGYCPTSVTE